MKKILIIDDQIEVLETIAGIIGDEIQCAIMFASNGHDGLTKFHRFLPDIIITDTNMLGMSGIEVIHAIKAERPDAKVILKSAKPENKTLADQEDVPFYCFRDFDSILKLI